MASFSLLGVADKQFWSQVGVNETLASDRAIVSS